MEPEREKRLHELLDEVLKQPTEERPAFLDAACGTDPELRRELDGLLAYEGAADRFLTSPAGSIHDFFTEPRPPELGRHIGAYRIEALLGRGGMADVYLASRVGDFQQRVALKLLPRFNTRAEVVGRFHNERQIQARLEHPHISRLLDGGTSDDGRPYFVMEYVSGVAIDAYCNDNALGVIERLGIFRKICEAVHFAHQRLVVHRDIKPSNILVTAAAEPKLLDFGIAKLLRPEDAAMRLETRTGTSPMTLLYASPEQVREEPISTTSDVYSLGVLLYQLLTGHLPGGLERARFSDVTRKICEEDPAPPSALVEGSSRRRELRGDVDAIVLKALRKDPADRYGSAAALAADVERHLRGQPVRARRGTFLYRGGKLVRRYRWPLFGVVFVAAVLLGLAVWEWQRLGAEHRRAEKVNAFLTGLFQQADPDERGSGQLTVRAILERGSRDLEGLADEPRLYAELVETLGRIQLRLGHYEEARGFLDRSLELWRRENPGDSPELALMLSNLGSVHYHNGAYGEAEELFRESLEVRRRLGEDDLMQVRGLNNLASVLVRRGAYGEAEDRYRRGLAIRRAVRPANPGAVATSLGHVGWVLYMQGELGEAEPLLREALDVLRELYAEPHTRVAGGAHLLGSVLLAAGKAEDAEPLLEEALAARRELLGDDHLEVARTRRQLAALILADGSPETAAVLLEEALATFYRVKQEGDWEIADAESLLGACLAALGAEERAAVCFRRGWETLEASLGGELLPSRQAYGRLR